MTDDELIDDDDALEAEPSSNRQRPAQRFSISTHLREFAALVVDLTVPRKKRDWRRKIEREWASLREGFGDKRPGTQKLYISRFRKAVKDAIHEAEEDPERARQLADEIVKGILVIDDEIIEAVEEEARLRIRNYVSNLVHLSHWEKLLAHFQALLDEDDARPLAVGLMAITGRRFSEILSAGTIQPVYKASDRGRVYQRYAVDFTGQLKTKEAEGSRFGDTYQVPVLAEARRVIAAFERLRASEEGRKWASMNSRTLNATVNKQLNRALRAQMGIAKLWPRGLPLSLRSLRAFYAELAYHHHAPSNVVKNAFFAYILGHAEDDFGTSLSYMRFALEPGGREARAEIERLQKLLEEQQAAVAAADAEG